MLKKAGIVVATAAAGLLALSPLAFAGDKGHDGGYNSYDEGETVGLVNVTDNNVDVPVQICNNDVPIQGGVAQGQVPVSDVTGALTGALGLLGSAEATSTTVTDNSRSCDSVSGAGDAVSQG